MNYINKIIASTNNQNAEKINWTKALSTKYPILKIYQKEVDIKKYSKEIRKLFNDLQNNYNYNELDVMLVLKDFFYHEYLDNKK